MSDVVLDASALLALLNKEEGAETVEQCLDKACMSAINLSEVISKLVEKGLSESLIREFVSHLNVEIIPVSKEQAVIAGFLRNQTRPYGLSLGDRTCIALGLHLNQTILTADRQWKKLVLKGVEIQILR